MADDPKPTVAPTPTSTVPVAIARPPKLVSHDTVQVEFMIDDLLKQLSINRVAVADCNGCNHCSAERDTVVNPIEEQ